MEILDLGGGAGYYSFLAPGKGHNVTLVDLSPTNIELVRKCSEAPGIRLKKYELGDATKLDSVDNRLGILRTVEDKQDLMAMSLHIIAVAGKILTNPAFS